MSWHLQWCTYSDFVILYEDMIGHPCIWGKYSVLLIFHDVAEHYNCLYLLYTFIYFYFKSVNNENSILVFTINPEQTKDTWVNVSYLYLLLLFLWLFSISIDTYDFQSKLLFAVYTKQRIIYTYAAVAYIIVLILGLLCLATYCCLCYATIKTPISKF